MRGERLSKQMESIERISRGSMLAEFSRSGRLLNTLRIVSGRKFDLAGFFGCGKWNLNCSALSFAQARALVWENTENKPVQSQSFQKTEPMAELLLTAAELLFQETGHSERMSKRGMAGDKQQKQSSEKKFKVIKAQAKRRHFFAFRLQRTSNWAENRALDGRNAADKRQK